MFTGIVEGIGSLAEVKGTGGGYRMRIFTPLSAEMKVGDSLAVNGVCLTVILVDGEHVMADVGPETARVTTFGALQRGQQVNLERPLRGDGRFDGHFVLGHVDGVGVIEEIRQEGESRWLTVGFQPALAPVLPFADLTRLEQNRYQGLVFTDDEGLELSPSAWEHLVGRPARAQALEWPVWVALSRQYYQGRLRG